MEKSKNEIDIMHGKGELKITCIERRYKVSDSRISFVITAKKELDEDTTGDILREDMELKTFLDNHEITDIVLAPKCSEEIETIKEKCPPGNVTKATTMERRELFDSLNLPNKFMIRDYRKALAERGVIISNSAMPYDDMDWFEKEGKVRRLEKGSRGISIFEITKKE